MRSVASHGYDVVIIRGLMSRFRRVANILGEEYGGAVRFMGWP